MKTELLRSYSSNNLTSLSRTSSKISLVLDRNSSPNLQQQRPGCDSTNNGKSVNLDVNLDKDDQNEDNVCLHKIFSEKGILLLLLCPCLFKSPITYLQNSVRKLSTQYIIFSIFK